MVGYGERQYEVKGIQRGDTQLKVAVKASKEIEGNLPFELSTNRPLLIPLKGLVLKAMYRSL